MAVLISTLPLSALANGTPNTIEINYSGNAYQYADGRVKATSDNPYTFNNISIENATVSSSSVSSDSGNKEINVNIILAPETQIGTEVSVSFNFSKTKVKKLSDMPRITNKYYDEFAQESDLQYALAANNSLTSISTMIASKTAVNPVKFYLYEASDYQVADYIVSVTLNFSVAGYTDGPDKNSVEGIAIAGQPEKTEYIEGEYFDPKGLSLTATLTSGAQSQPFCECTWEPSGMLQPSDTQITVCYGNATATIPITVLAANSLIDAEILNNAGVFIYKPYLLDENQKEIIGNDQQPSEKGIGKIVTPFDTKQIQIKLTLSNENTKVFIGDNEQQKETNQKECIITIPSSSESSGATTSVVLKTDEQADKEYSFICYTQLYSDLPNSVVDYLCIASQFSNGGNAYNPYIGINGIATLIGYGSTMSGSLSSPPTSLGNFGGYITYYYENALMDDPANPYGIDFIVYGNPYLPSENYVEPGIVMVSENGEDWFTLAGSEHYEDYVKWDYQITYSRAENGKAKWKDNQGNSGITVYDYVERERYPLHFRDYTVDDDAITLKGPLISVHSNEKNAEYGNLLFYPQFGYADRGAWNNKTNAADNPYEPLEVETSLYHVGTHASDGFDLAWAVDSSGDSVSFPRGIHYIKIQTAQFLGLENAIGEPSPEINYVRRAQAPGDNVGKTDAPSRVTIDGVDIFFVDDQPVNATVSGPFAVEVAARENSNIIINSYRSSRREYNEMPAHKTIRIIVQDGEKAPWIGIIHLSGNNTEKDIHTITFDISSDSTSNLKLGSIFHSGTAATDGSALIVRKYDADMSGTLLPTPWISDNIKRTFIGWQYGIYTFTTYDHEAIPDGATLTAVWSTAEENTASDDVTVSFRLIGSSKSSADVDLSTGNYNGAAYQTWIPTDEYTITTANTVLDLIKTAADAAGVTYEDTGNYIKSVTAPEAFGGTKLTAMDNGSKSGWMYTVNGEHGLLGISQQTLADGDSVVVHYVDDYSYEVADWDRLGGTGYPAQSVSTYHNAWLKAVDKVTLSESELVLTLGETESADLTATVTPADAVYDTLTWASSDESVATVSNGKVTAVAAGTADITATAGDITGTCKVTVKEPDTVLAESVTLNKSELGLAVGESEKLTATVLPENTTDKSVVWTSSKDSVATVSSDGTVTAVSVGDAVITATCGAKSDECTVSVTAALGTVTEVKLNKSTLPLTVGDTETLIATVLPSDAGVTVNWSSSAKNIATVDDSGKVTAVAPGPATITAEAGGKSVTCEVTVPEKVEFANTVLGKTAEYVYKTVTEPTLAQVGGEWAVLGLARSGFDVPEAYYQGYYARLVAAVKSESGNLGKAYTEYSRIILALTALGKNPANVGGYDLLSHLGDYDKTIWQGNNSTIFALIALDAGSYEIPTNADAATQATRQMYIDLLLRNQLNDGGWTLDSTGGTGSSGVDYTAMALQALAKYKDQPAVAVAIEKALNRLSELQNDDGGFSFGSDGANAESAAQVIVALDELGISLDDARFVKNGKTVLDALLTFRNDDGSFKHLASDTISNQMATEQALYAFVSADRAKNGKPTLYTMSDHLNISGDGTAIPVASITLNKSSESVEVGKTVALTATVLPVNATSKSVIWTSSDVSIATVKNGVVTGVKEGVSTITAKVGDFTATCTVTVTEASTPTPTKTKIKVTFSLLGDAVHDSTADGKFHGLKMGGLTTWIASTSYELEEGSTVKDLFEKALTEAGMTWSNPPGDGNYVESITRNGVTLGEFTNGANSGWMYTLNGDKHPNKGYAEQVLSDGDVVTWHYTDDYTKENDVESWGEPAGGKKDEKKDGEAETVTTTTDVVADDGTKIHTETESTTASKTNDDGSVTETVTETKTETATAPDGSKTVTETVTESEKTSNSEKNGDGSVTETVSVNEKVTETVTAADGSKTTTVTETSEKRNVEKTVGADGKTTGNGTFSGKTTITAADGSKTSAVTEGTISVNTDEAGTVSEVTTAKTTTTDASGKVTVESTVTTEAQMTNGSTGKTVEDDQGNTLTAEATISEEAVKTAKETGEPITVPVNMNPTSGATLVLNMPENADSVVVEIPVLKTGPGIVAFQRFAGGILKLVKNCIPGSVIVPVEGDCELVIADNTKYFTDVNTSSWYGDSVTFVTAREIFNGNGDGTFAPTGTMNRAMAAQMIYNYDDSAAAGDGSVFSDVASDAWYNAAVGWAAGVNLITGYDGAYHPLADITRQDLVTILYRYAKQKGYDTEGVGDDIDLTAYADGTEVSDYAAAAMRWAIASGLVNGYEDSTLRPRNTATRAEVAAIMQRLIVNTVK